VGGTAKFSLGGIEGVKTSVVAIPEGAAIHGHSRVGETFQKLATGMQAKKRRYAKR